MSFFRKCCRCFSKEKEVVSPQQGIPNEIHIQEPEQQQPEPLVEIETKFHLPDLKISEFTPSSTQKLNFSYNCPICLRYFNTILVLKCCKQYICHFCIEDLSKSVKFEVACPHCKKIPVQASDVDFNSTVKKYSDSPFGTFKQSKDPENKWVQLKVVNESVESDESVGALENLNFSFNHEMPVVNSNMRMTA
jgi:hypothetical protein